MILYNFRRGRGLGIVVGIIFTLILMVSSVNASTTINVCSTCTYTSIQDAIDAASSGDTIEVHSGTYNENLNVDKKLNLKGVDTGNGKPVISQINGNILVKISSDGTQFEGFVIKGFQNNNLVDFGIMVLSSNNVIAENSFDGFIDVAISVGGSNNEINNNRNENGGFEGIMVGGHSNTVKSNIFYVSEHGIRVEGSDHTITGNTIGGGSMYGSLRIEGGSNNIIDENTINSYCSGIYIEIGWLNGMKVDADGNTIINNIINNEGSHFCSDPTAGINIDEGNNNLIYGNNIISDHGHNAIDVTGTNQWDNGIIGNHYSNFDEESEGCFDSDENGICDSSFNIPSYDDGSGTIEYGNIGRYALVSWPLSDSPEEIPEFPSVAIPVISALGLMLISTLRKNRNQ